MNYKQTTTILAARELSRLNQVIGYLLLLWPLLMLVVMRSTRPVRVLFWGLLAAVVICSYSRGGLVAVCVLVLLTFMKFRPLQILYLSAPVGIAYLIAANPLDLQLIDNWALRFHLHDLTGGHTTAETLGVLFETARLDIYGIAWNTAVQSNLLGIGLGQLPEAIQTATGGQWYLTGHNMLLTVLAERGLGPALFVMVVFIILFALHFKNLLSGAPDMRRRGWLGLVSFGLFIIYAHTEGVELVNCTGRLVDAQTCFYIILNLVVALWNRSQSTSKTQA
jgi:O-antigen ligase